MNDTAENTTVGEETPEAAPASAKISRWAEVGIVKLEHALGQNFKKMQTARQGARVRLATALGQLDASLEASLLRGERTATSLLESARGALIKEKTEATEPLTPASG
jgi:hypothetical protein